MTLPPCTGMGYLGAALATSLLYLVRTAVLLGYMQYTGVRRLPLTEQQPDMEMLLAP